MKNNLRLKNKNKRVFNIKMFTYDNKLFLFIN